MTIDDDSWRGSPSKDERCCREHVFHNISHYFTIFHNISQYFTIGFNIFQHTKVFHNIYRSVYLQLGEMFSIKEKEYK